MKRIVSVFMMAVLLSLELAASPFSLLASRTVSFAVGMSAGMVRAEIEGDAGWPASLALSGEACLMFQDEIWNMAFREDVSFLSRDGVFGYSWAGGQPPFSVDSLCMIRFTPFYTGLSVAAGGGFRYDYSTLHGHRFLGEVIIEPSWHVDFRSSQTGMRIALPMKFVFADRPFVDISLALLFYVI